MRFTSRCRQRRFEHLIQHCGLQKCKLHMVREGGDGCQVRPDFGNQGLVQEGQPEARGFQSIP